MTTVQPLWKRPEQIYLKPGDNRKALYRTLCIKGTLVVFETYIAKETPIDGEKL